MLLYSSESSPRLSYITSFIGHELFRQIIRITTNKQEFRSHEGPKINYSTKVLAGNEFKISNVALLFEKHITSQQPECFVNAGHKAFFQTIESDFPFDIFAAAFYLLSRYEEYTEHTLDQYGRYSHVNSLAFKESFIHLPLVNIWLKDLKIALSKKFPDLVYHPGKFIFNPTYDIDIAYSYANKGARRNCGGFLQSASRMQWNCIIERAAVLLNKRNDPFDCFERLNNLHSNYGVKALYFFLVAEKTKQYDRNILPKSAALQELIRFHAARYQIGIHPSWQSGESEKVLKKEVRLLEKVSGEKIVNSRQHYLRLTLPETYRTLLNAGIENDYSLGYGNVNGFRASVASSFYWYDLRKDEPTGLQIFPFCFMDATAYYHQKLTPLQALDELMSYFNSIRSVNGLMITIWHNHILGTGREFEGWPQVHEKFLHMNRDELE
ncbi:MAG: polysaccharide deacetylase family protein [Chitinophagaceae bacterium]